MSVVQVTGSEGSLTVHDTATLSERGLSRMEEMRSRQSDALVETRNVMSAVAFSGITLAATPPLIVPVLNVVSPRVASMGHSY